MGNGIEGFGDLTIRVKLQNGGYQEIKISDTGADANNNGKIDSGEFKNLVEYINERYGQVADTFNFNSLATLHEDDQNITAEEFDMWLVWEQEREIDETIENKLNVLLGYYDLFMGNENIGNYYIMREALQQFKAEFMSPYIAGELSGDITNMATHFADEIDGKIEEIIAEILHTNKIENTVSGVIDTFYPDGLDDNDYSRIYEILSGKAQEYLNSHPNASAADLTAELNGYLSKDSVRQYNDGNEYLDNWNAVLANASANGHIGEGSETAILKIAAADLIKAAYSYGIGFVKNGHEVTEAELLAQINNYSNDITGANKLVTLITHINNVLEEIGSCTVAELLLQGKDKVKIDITNGDVVQTQTLNADSAKAIIRKTIEAILSDYENYPSNILQQAGELLRTKANAFYSSNTNLKPDEFETKLRAHLDEYMENPIGNIHDELQEYYDAGMQPFGEDFNLSGYVSHEEFEFLQDMFRKIISTAANHHVIILDSNGQKITTGNVNDFLSGFEQNSADATSLYRIIDEIMRRLDSLEGNLIKLLASNAGNGIDVTINIDGTIVTPTVGQTNLEGAQGAIDDTIDNILSHYCQGVSQEIRNRIQDRLLELANAYLANYQGNNLDDFIDNIGEYLADLFIEPFGYLADDLYNISNNVNGITISGCTDTDYENLKEQFNALMALLGSYVQLVDSNGNPLNINLDSYGRDHADALKALILNIISAIMGYTGNMQQLFETYEDGKITVYIRGTSASLTKPPVQTGGLPTGFGQYDFNEIVNLIRNNAKSWCNGLYTEDSELFNRLFETSIQAVSSSIVTNGIICCDPSVFQQAVKTKFEAEYKSSPNMTPSEGTYTIIDSGYEDKEKSWNRKKLESHMDHNSTFYKKLKAEAEKECNKYNVTFNESTFRGYFLYFRGNVLDGLPVDPDHSNRVICNARTVARQVANEVCKFWNGYIKNQL